MTYIVVGPMVACVAFYSLNALFLEEAESALLIILFAFPHTIGGFYWLGWKAAAFTGFVMALIEPRLARPWAPFAIAALVGGFVSGLFFPPLFTDGVTRDVVLGSASIGAVSGLACAAIDHLVQARLLNISKKLA